MRIFPQSMYIQNLNGSVLRENFMVAAISTIMIIRIFLKLTGYPSLGGSQLHIAHLLWGGLFLLAAILLLLSFLSRSATHLASILAGIGFGAFIDELGKFITRDNNYFFRPTTALIYALFVLLFITFRFIDRQKATRKEYLVNALEMVKEAVIKDLDDEEKEQAFAYLKKCNQKSKLVLALQEFLHDVEALPATQPSLFIKIRRWITDYYFKLAKSKVLARFLIVLLIFQSSFIILATAIGEGGVALDRLTFSETGRLFSAGLALFLIVLGLISIVVNGRYMAYRLIKMSVLTLLLLTQFFQFYDDAFLALIGIVFNLLLLLVVDYALDKEQPKVR